MYKIGPETRLESQAGCQIMKHLVLHAKTFVILSKAVGAIKEF